MSNLQQLQMEDERLRGLIATEKYAARQEKREQQIAARVEAPIATPTIAVMKVMRTSGVTPKELARRLGKQHGCVRMALAINGIGSIRELYNYANALNHDVEIRLVPRQQESAK